jgi:transposase
MTSPSEQYPWIVEMRAPAFERWYSIGAFRERWHAEQILKLARVRQPNAKFRIEWFDPQTGG